MRISHVVAALLVAANGGVPFAASEQPKNTAGAARKGDDVDKTYESLLEDHKRKLERIANEFAEAQAKQMRSVAEELLRLAGKHTGSPVAVRALAYIVQNIDDAKYRGAAIRKLAKDHATDDGIGTVCPILVAVDDGEADGFLVQVLAKNPSRKAKGAACLCLAQRWENKADAAQNNDDECKGALLQAEKYFRMVNEKYADLAGDEGKTAGSVAADGLKHLSVIASLAVGKVAPESEGVAAGRKFRLADLRGKVVVLEFGAVWCGPCRELKPQLADLRTRLRGQPFELLEVDSDTNEALTTKWNVHSIPAVFVLDDQGIIRYKGVRGKALDDAVDFLLKRVRR
jgi:thiol-disulfide isomerase/thioredoxin